MKRILVIATRQIGDVLLTTPVVRAAKQRWPQASIDVVGFAGTLGMLRGNPDVHELIETPARLGWRGFWRLAGALWRAYDLALIADQGDRAHLMGWLSARLRSGILPAGHGSNWWKRRLLVHAVESGGDGSTVHVVREKLELLAPWRNDGPTAVPVVAPPAAPLPDDIAQALQPVFVAMHAPSMWPYKQWAPENYRRVAEALIARGVQVVLTGSGGQRDQACIAPLRSLAAAPRLLDVSGRLDFNQLSGLVGRAAAYVGPDTSVSHLAAATGVPTVAIFGPTNPQRWAPWPSTGTATLHRRELLQTAGNVTLLQAGLPCVPCTRAGCKDHVQSHSDCLAVITPERVLEAVLRTCHAGLDPASSDGA
ncbi:MAG: glycosyltransferase family 9 protein [Ramlibacter sp.]